jgi:hypothetical protein
MFARPGFDLYPNDLDSIHREHEVESANVVFDYLGSRRRFATQPNPLLAEQCNEWAWIAIRRRCERLVAFWIVIVAEEHEEARYRAVAERAAFQRLPEWAGHGDAPEAGAGLLDGHPRFGLLVGVFGADEGLSC